MNVKIKGMTVLSYPKPNRRGRTIIAYFDCLAGPFELLGCALSRTEHDVLVVTPPRLEGNGSLIRRITFRDDELRTSVKDRSLAAYLALGGEHHEGPLPEPPAQTKFDDSEFDSISGVRRYLSP